MPVLEKLIDFVLWMIEHQALVGAVSCLVLLGALSFWFFIEVKNAKDYEDYF